MYIEAFLFSTGSADAAARHRSVHQQTPVTAPLTVTVAWDGLVEPPQQQALVVVLGQMCYQEEEVQQRCP